MARLRNVNSDVAMTGSTSQRIMRRMPVPSKRAAPMTPRPTEFVIVDERIKPDAMGSLGGQRIYERDGLRYVKMTPRQAQYFLDHRAIAVEGQQEHARFMSRRNNGTPKGGKPGEDRRAKSQAQREAQPQQVQQRAHTQERRTFVDK
jgi:hypothetical protein